MRRFEAKLFQQSQLFCPLSGRGAPLNRGYAQGAGIFTTVTLSGVEGLLRYTNRFLVRKMRPRNDRHVRG